MPTRADIRLSQIPIDTPTHCPFCYMGITGYREDGNTDCPITLVVFACDTGAVVSRRCGNSLLMFEQTALCKNRTTAMRTTPA